MKISVFIPIISFFNYRIVIFTNRPSILSELPFQVYLLWKFFKIKKKFEKFQNFFSICLEHFLSLIQQGKKRFFLYQVGTKIFCPKAKKIIFPIGKKGFQKVQIIANKKRKVWCTGNTLNLKVSHIWVILLPWLAGTIDEPVRGRYLLS